MSRFGPDPRAFFDSVYRDVPPWDVGGPQPALSALLAAHPPGGPVLDVGCGSGDLAISLARSGLEVCGVDFAEGAIAHAREKARALPPEVARRLDFRVADALRPSRLGRRFGAVVDSGFFHLFDPEDGDRFVRELAAALRPGGRYYLLAFAAEFPIPNSPRAVSEDEVRARFTPESGWRVLSVRGAEFLSRIAPVPAVAACVERLPPRGLTRRRIPDSREVRMNTDPPPERPASRSAVGRFLRRLAWRRAAGPLVAEAAVEVREPETEPPRDDDRR